MWPRLRWVRALGSEVGHPLPRPVKGGSGASCLSSMSTPVSIGALQRRAAGLGSELEFQEPCGELVGSWGIVWKVSVG